MRGGDRAAFFIFGWGGGSTGCTSWLEAEGRGGRGQGWGFGVAVLLVPDEGGSTAGARWDWQYCWYQMGVAVLLVPDEGGSTAGTR